MKQENPNSSASFIRKGLSSSPTTTILLVEDEEPVTLSTERILKKSGYEVIISKTGENAIDIVNHKSINMILMDIVLGKGTDGIETAQEILKNHDIPLIFLTSHSEPEFVEKVDKITSYGYILKSSESSVFIASIKMAFRLHESNKNYKKLNRLYSLLSKIDESIVRIHDKQELFNGICRITLDYGKFLMAWIGILNNDNKIDIVASAGVSRDYLDKINIDLNNKITSKDPAGRVIKSGKYAISNNIADDENMVPWRKDALKAGYKSSAAFPIKISGIVKCVINFYSDEVEYFAEDEIKLLDKLVSNLSFAIEFIENEEKRKQAEKKLIENEKKLREAQKMAHLGFWYWNVRTGDVEWSDEVFQIFYLDPKVFKPHIDSILALSPWPEDNQRDKELIDRAIESHNPGNYEQKFLRPDNSIGYYYSTFQGNYDENGQLISIVGTVLDITERKLVENRFSRHNKLLKEINAYAIELAYLTYNQLFYHVVNKIKTLFNLKSAWISIYDEKTSDMVIMCSSLSEEENNMIVKILGKEIIGLRMHVNDEQYRIMTKNNVVILSSLNELTLGVMPKFASESIKDIFGYGWFMPIVLMNKGKIVGTLTTSGYSNQEPPDGEELLIFAEITAIMIERKRGEEEIYKLNEELEHRVIERTEELKTSNKELESFSYSISHDLRAPLRAINGFTNILLEDYSEKLDEEGKRLFKIICDNAKKMSNLIDDLLTFSRINRYEIKKSEIDMKTLVYSIYNETDFEQDREKITFSVDNLPDVKGDSAMIRQLWVNLISNAVKYTSKKENPIIEIGFKSENGNNIYFIKDNGVGFDMKYYDKLFGVFQRLHTENEFKGTGAGLSIAKSIVSKHGGKIWAKSEVNVGTTFYFYLE